MGESGNGKTKSQEYAKAVAKATGREMEVVTANDEKSLALAMPVGLGDLVQAWDPGSLALDMAKNDFEWSPRVIKLEEGMLLDGILEGRGGTVEIEQSNRVERTVEIKHVGSWVLRHPTTGMRLSFLTASQLEDKLPPFIGSRIRIYVGPMLEARNGHRYRDYAVGGERLKDGKTRSFARGTAAPVIDVPQIPDAEDLISSDHAQ